MENRKNPKPNGSGSESGEYWTPPESSRSKLEKMAAGDATNERIYDRKRSVRGIEILSAAPDSATSAGTQANSVKNR